MPQIWPMNWVILFIFFILTFYVYLSLFYFTTNSTLDKDSKDCLKTSKLSTIEWKW